MANNGPQERPQVSGDQPASTPAMPTVPPEQLYRGTPYLVLDGGLRHSLGWQDYRQGGPNFVVTTTQRGTGARKVSHRFPFTHDGWADAWQTLTGLDTRAAAAVGARLAQLEAGQRVRAELAALDARSLCHIRSATYSGGSDSGSLTKGDRYDLRFLTDRITVCTPGSVRALLELPYADVETVDVSEPANQSTEVVLGWVAGLGLAGAVLGFLVAGFGGLLVGAVVLALIGGLIGAAASKKDTILRVRGPEAELNFLDPAGSPDQLRTALSEPLVAIRKANAAEVGSSEDAAKVTSGSIPDQLAKLAGLLQQELITRDEFEHLKAKLLAES